MTLKAQIQSELRELQALAQQTPSAALGDGSWLLLAIRESFDGYTDDTHIHSLRTQHPGQTDVHDLAQARISDATKRATIAGGLSAGAYASVVMATLASGGLAGITLPAAAAAFAADLYYVTRVQLRLAWDLSVIYDTPLNIQDDTDLRALTRVAFGVELDQEAHHATKGLAPLASRLGTRATTSIVRLASRPALQTVGRTLALRSLAKFAIPAIGVPLCAGINYLTTRSIGYAARDIFRGQDRARRLACTLRSAPNQQLLSRTVLLILRADGRLRAAESALVDDLIQGWPDAGLVTLDAQRDLATSTSQLYTQLADASPDVQALVFESAVHAALLDGELHSDESKVLGELAKVCGQVWNAERAAQIQAAHR
ncbi:MAG: hypothetical protein GWP91_25625 [Rhodobacterales bacterium]|nr:hypothetical protein [Rhodobacterales bacterium]